MSFPFFGFCSFPISHISSFGLLYCYLAFLFWLFVLLTPHALSFVQAAEFSRILNQVPVVPEFEDGKARAMILHNPQNDVISVY